MTMKRMESDFIVVATVYPNPIITIANSDAIVE